MQSRIKKETNQYQQNTKISVDLKNVYRMKVDPFSVWTLLIISHIKVKNSKAIMGVIKNLSSIFALLVPLGQLERETLK